VRAIEQTVLDHDGSMRPFFSSCAGLTVNTKLITACFVVATVLSPHAARAAEPDLDRANPVNFVKDSVITTKVKAKLAAQEMHSLARIGVDTDRNGMVVLSGSASNQQRADKAVAIARDTEGVTSVRNNIRIQKED
jgi:hyperosmotically inducible protein